MAMTNDENDMSMINVDLNMNDIKEYMGKSYILEY
jgi:hypothetical protein